MTARMMKELDADAVCMQELDSCTTRTKHVFQVKRFAELMGWEYVYAKPCPIKEDIMVQDLPVKIKF